MSNGTLAEN